MLQRPRGSISQLFIGGLALAIVLALGLRGQTRGENTTSAPPSDPIGAGTRQQQLATLPDLDEYDWTRWLVGEWEGWSEDPLGNRTPWRQSFEYIVDGRYILSRLRLEQEGGPPYVGVGIFSYDPVRGQSSGEWFGIFGDRNYALGRRDGERWVWDIHRHGRQRVLRVRERLSEDEYRVTSTSIDAEGRERVTKEHMRRVKDAGALGSGS